MSMQEIVKCTDRERCSGQGQWVIRQHSHSTQDGVEFIPAVFYAAASRNIGVLLRYNGKCRAWANNLYATPDAVEKLIVEFVQRYEKFSDKQKLEFKTKNGLL